MNKPSTNAIVLIVCVLLVAGFFAVSEPIDEIEHKYVLSFRNFLLFVIGFYYYFFFKWQDGVDQPKSENPVSARSPWSDFKSALTQVPPMILVLGYSLVHWVVLYQVGMTLPYMMLDILLIGLQVVFFIYLIAIANHLHATESATFILIMISMLNILTIAGNYSFYLLLNPFGGWIYAVHLIGEGNIALQYVAIMALIVGIGLLLLGLKKSSERQLDTNSVKVN